MLQSGYAHFAVELWSQSTYRQSQSQQNLLGGVAIRKILLSTFSSVAEVLQNHIQNMWSMYPIVYKIGFEIS